jgi:hypothetical protein
VAVARRALEQITQCLLLMSSPSLQRENSAQCAHGPMRNHSPKSQRRFSHAVRPVRAGYEARGRRAG